MSDLTPEEIAAWSDDLDDPGMRRGESEMWAARCEVLLDAYEAAAWMRYEARAEAERLREALLTICDIGETRDVLVARAALDREEQTGLGEEP